MLKPWAYKIITSYLVLGGLVNGCGGHISGRKKDVLEQQEKTCLRSELTH